MGSPNNELDTIEQKISNTLSQVLVTDEVGKKVIDWSKAPEDITPELKVAVIAEKRRRDTQASYTKVSQNLKTLEAEKEALIQLAQKAVTELPAEKQEELEELKWSDPDAYYREMRKLELEVEQKSKEKLNTLLTEASSKVLKENEILARQEYINSFNALHPDKPLTMEMLELQIPAKYIKDLEEGKVSFEETIQKAHTFIYGAKQVANPQTPDQPSLGQVGKQGMSGKATQDKDEDIIY